MAVFFPGRKDYPEAMPKKVRVHFIGSSVHRIDCRSIPIYRMSLKNAIFFS